jgi:hypothetical protein
MDVTATAETTTKTMRMVSQDVERALPGLLGFPEGVAATSRFKASCSAPPISPEARRRSRILTGSSLPSERFLFIRIIS